MSLDSDRWYFRETGCPAGPAAPWAERSWPSTTSSPWLLVAATRLATSSRSVQTATALFTGWRQGTVQSRLMHMVSDNPLLIGGGYSHLRAGFVVAANGLLVRTWCLLRRCHSRRQWRRLSLTWDECLTLTERDWSVFRQACHDAALTLVRTRRWTSNVILKPGSWWV